jgi:hypothetical protein
MKNWQTSLVGVLVIGVGVVHSIVAHKVDAEAMGMMTAGVGLTLSADAQKPKRRRRQAHKPKL